MEIGSRTFGGERGCQTSRSREYLRAARRSARSPNDPASATLGEASQRAIAQSTDVEPDRLSVLSADGSYPVLRVIYSSVYEASTSSSTVTTNSSTGAPMMRANLKRVLSFEPPAK